MTSKTYCPLPFMHLNIGPRSAVSPCCHYDEKVGETIEDIRYMDLSDVFRSKKWYTLQKQLISGQKPAGCHKCYSDEDNNIKSQRDIAIERWGTAHTSSSNIKSVELKLGAKCNLACRTCSSDSSNKWLKEESLMWFGNVNKDWMKKKQEQSFWASDESFWQQMYSISDDIEQITFTGGEPMLINEHFHYLSWLADNNKKPHIDYITNGTIPLAKAQKVFDRFDSISMSISIDAVGKLSDYIRTGSDWELLYNNIKDYNDYFKKRGFHIDIASTVSILNVHELHRMAKLTSKLDISWTLNFLNYPEWMSILSLSQPARDYVIENIESVKGHVTSEKMKVLYEVIKFFNNTKEVDLDNLPIWRHILQRDMRHNTANSKSISFSRVQPEWWDILIGEGDVCE